MDQLSLSWVPQKAPNVIVWDPTTCTCPGPGLLRRLEPSFPIKVTRSLLVQKSELGSFTNTLMHPTSYHLLIVCSVSVSLVVLLFTERPCDTRWSWCSDGRWENYDLALFENGPDTPRILGFRWGVYPSISKYSWEVSENHVPPSSWDNSDLMMIFRLRRVATIFRHLFLTLRDGSTCQKPTGHSHWPTTVSAWHLLRKPCWTRQYQISTLSQ